MLRSTRLPPGRRTLLPHPSVSPPTSNSSSSPTIVRRCITFVTGKNRSPRPFTVTGTRTAAKLSPPLRSWSPWTWSPSTISTLAGGTILAGTWYIMHEGRSYKVAEEADKYEPRVIGAHREGKVNPDYVSYEHWVETHGLKLFRRETRRLEGD
ncbi:hypothetical protein C8A03DRAFT_43344 [Achaetomium macrosporum]|uniref:Uncharacterized protein n=1 Tax=Achaetomium macrosporum TaxID=79813 RepID=A0AAN7CBH0_9PEZI|nr:hypothetical protein C8A03DRAFT_43344 [Achaetomium macrosporum]